MFSEISKKKLKNGGFSLIELIIVVAIMVALIAVLAPSYIKYVKKARDAVITQAAEEVLTLVKVSYGENFNGEGAIKICANEDNHISLTFEDYSNVSNTLSFIDDEGNTGIEAFKKACGIQADKLCQSNMIYYIYIRNNVESGYASISSHPELIIEEETVYVENK